MKGRSAAFVTRHESGTVVWGLLFCPTATADNKSEQRKERRRLHSLEPPVERVFYLCKTVG